MKVTLPIESHVCAVIVHKKITLVNKKIGLIKN